MNPEPIQTSKRIPLLLGAGILLTVAIMLITLSNARKEKQQLKIEMDTLSAQNTTLNETLQALQNQLDAFQSGVHSGKKNTVESADKPARTVTPKPVEPETLLLQPPKVVSSNQGLHVRLVFESTEQELPEIVALVVRLPSAVDAEIYALQAADNASFSNVKARVDASGKFAVFQGTPADLHALQFELIVTAPVTATIRGSKGIRAFELDITPDSPAVRKL